MSAESIRTYHSLWNDAVFIKREEALTGNSSYNDFFRILFLGITAYFQEIFSYTAIKASLTPVEGETVKKVDWVSSKIFDLLGATYTAEEAALAIAEEAASATEVGTEAKAKIPLNDFVGTEATIKLTMLEEEIKLLTPLVELPKLFKNLRQVTAELEAMRGKSSPQKMRLKGEKKALESLIARYKNEAERNKSNCHATTINLDHPRLKSFPGIESLKARLGFSIISLREIDAIKDPALKRELLKAFSQYDPRVDRRQLIVGIKALNKARLKEAGKSEKFTYLTYDGIQELQKRGLDKDAAATLRDYLVDFTVRQLAADFGRRSISFDIDTYHLDGSSFEGKPFSYKLKKAQEVYKIVYQKLHQLYKEKTPEELELATLAALTATIQTYDAIMNKTTLSLFSETLSKVSRINADNQPPLIINAAHSNLRNFDDIRVVSSKDGLKITQKKARELAILNPFVTLVAFRSEIEEETLISRDLSLIHTSTLKTFDPTPLTITL